MGQERDTWERARDEHRYGVPPDPERFAVPSRPAIGSVLGSIGDLFANPETGPMVGQVKRTLDGAPERPPMPIEKRVAHGIVWGLVFAVPAAVLLHKNAMLPKRAAPALSIWERAAQEREHQAAAAPVERRKAPQVTVRHE